MSENMLNSSNTVKYKFWILVFTMILIIFTLLVSISFDKHFSADGVHYFIKILQTYNFTYIDWTRQFANYLSQIFLVIGVNLGIKDFNILSMLYGISLILPYFLTFLLSLFALRNEDKSIMLFVFISMILINLTSDFILVGEHHLLALLSWPILFFLLRRTALVSWDIFYLFLLMFLYTRLYSTAIIPTILFMILALLRSIFALQISQRIYYTIAGLLSMVAGAISIYSILYPRSIENKAGFSEIILQSLYTPEIIASIFFLIFFFTGWFFRQRILVWISIIPIIFFLIYTYHTDYAITAGQSFGNRSLTVTLLPLLLLIATILHWKMKEAIKSIYIIFMSFILMMLFSNILNTLKWNQFRKEVLNILQTENGYILNKDTSLVKSEYKWSWTMSQLSVVWSRGCVKTIILNDSSISWEPFNPLKESILASYTCYNDKLFKLFSSNTSLCKCYQKNILAKNIKFDSSEVIFDGWSYKEKSHRWSLGKESKIIFSKINNYSKVQGVLSFYVKTLGEQELKITINDKYIGSQKVNRGKNRAIQFKFNPKILNIDSINIIKFEFPNAHRPNNGDPRVLAIALKSFKIK